MQWLRLCALGAALAGCAACGGGDGDDGSGSDGGGGGEDPCGFASDDYLPYQVGFSWTFSVTDLGTGALPPGIPAGQRGASLGRAAARLGRPRAGC